MEEVKNTDVTVEQSQGAVTGTEKPEVKEEKLFKQEDVNNIVAREVKENQEKLFKDLGIEDFESAKDGLAKFREWQDEQKTEKEKATEKMNALEKENADFKAQLSTLAAKNEALKQGVKGEAVDDVILLAQSQVSEEVTIEQAIKNVLEKYPQFGSLKKDEDKKQIKFMNGGNSTGTNGNEDIVDKVLKSFNYR